jgi:hypothetical protein
LGVRLGEYNILSELDCDSKGLNCEPPVQDLLIDKITIHEKYNPSTYVNDIALIRLATPANTTQGNFSNPVASFHLELFRQRETDLSAPRGPPQGQSSREISHSDGMGRHRDG